MRSGKNPLGLLPAMAMLAFALAPAATAARIDWARARLVTVTAVDYRFIPSHLVFRPGIPYHLRVVNRGKEMHELHAPDFFKEAVIRNPTALNQEHSELVLDPGATKDLYFVAERRGRYDMRCPDHDWAGMTGDITVK
jgi:uncharacterized cupredoxin-like copper-binding protein